MIFFQCWKLKPRPFLKFSLSRNLFLSTGKCFSFWIFVYWGVGGPTNIFVFVLCIFSPKFSIICEMYTWMYTSSQTMCACENFPKCNVYILRNYVCILNTHCKTRNKENSKTESESETTERFGVFFVSRFTMCVQYLIRILLNWKHSC